MFSGDSRKNIEETIEIEDIASADLDQLIGSEPAQTIREELELIDQVYPKFNREEYLKEIYNPYFLVLL